MILRRIVEHIKQQQWSAFAIELVIVVLGVFIGLQVDNWNDERRDRVREQVYLAGIAADLKESIDSIRVSIDLKNERIALDEFLIRAADDPEVVRSDPGRFIYAITRGGYTFAPVIRGYTFDEIKSTGDLGIIRDQKLVLDLMKFYADVQGQAQWEYLRANNQSEYIRRSAGILTAQQLMSAPASTQIIPVTSVEDAMTAYQRMLDRPEFVDWVPTTLFYRATGTDERWLEQATALRARLLAEPGVGKRAAPSGTRASARQPNSNVRSC
jgi:hypothetical protein